jgi:anti-sigma factor RsiW
VNHSREIDELLSAYVDGVLSREEQAAVERLLARDPEARRKVAAYRALAAAAPPPESDPALNARIAARVRALRRPPADWRAWLPATAAALVVAVVLVGSGLLPGTYPDPAAQALVDSYLEAVSGWR